MWRLKKESWSGSWTKEQKNTMRSYADWWCVFVCVAHGPHSERVTHVLGRVINPLRDLVKADTTGPQTSNGNGGRLQTGESWPLGNPRRAKPNTDYSPARTSALVRSVCARPPCSFLVFPSTTKAKQVVVIIRIHRQEVRGEIGSIIQKAQLG